MLLLPWKLTYLYTPDEELCNSGIEAFKSWIHSGLCFKPPGMRRRNIANLGLYHNALTKCPHYVHGHIFLACLVISAIIYWHETQVEEPDTIPYNLIEVLTQDEEPHYPI